MTTKIKWQSPTDTNITKVRIDRATTKYGTYEDLLTPTYLDATSDGAAKTSSNTWVTSYIDGSGGITNWYKVSFYDGINSVWTEFSEPITTREDIKLCTIQDIKDIIDTVGRFTDDEIFDAIEEMEEDIYDETGTPINAIYSPIGSIDSVEQDTYYVGEENIFRVDRLFYGTSTKTEYFEQDGYKTNLQYGMVRLLPVASGGPILTTTDTIEVHYVPRIYNRLCIFRTAKLLLEKVDYSTKGSTSKELEIISKRLDKVEIRLQNRICPILSSRFKNYEETYGKNRKKVIQDHDKNKYIGNYGWD